MLSWTDLSGDPYRLRGAGFYLLVTDRLRATID